MIGNSGCISSLVPWKIGNRFGHVFQHVGEHIADMPVYGYIEDLLADALGTHDPCRAQQTQVVTHQRLRQTQRLGNRPDRAPLVRAGEHDAQAGRIAQQAEQIGNGDDTVVGD
jgi:hypothetical protein